MKKRFNTNIEYFLIDVNGCIYFLKLFSQIFKIALYSVEYV